MEDMQLRMGRIALIRHIVNLAQDFDRVPGKTSIQKIVYFLQEGLGKPLGYRFKMHYYGPYSESVDNDLSLADAMGCVEISLAQDGFGYSIRPGEFTVDDAEHSMPLEGIDGTIRDLAALPLLQLELLATVHFIQNIRPHWDRSKVVETVGNVKPKFSQQKIEDAYRDIERRGLIEADSSEGAI